MIIEKMYTTIFQSDEWVQLDLGLLTLEEAGKRFCLREPDYAHYVHQTMSRLPEMLTPKNSTLALLPKILECGHALYFLSNYPRELSVHIQEVHRFFDLFSGGVFSCDVHLLKPSPDIYRYLLDQYDLSPQDCLFIDDMQENVLAAQRMGIQGVLFTGVDSITQYIVPANK